MVFSGILNYALKQGWVDTNPVDAVSVPRITTADDDMVILTIEQVERLAEAASLVGKRPDARRRRKNRLSTRPCSES